MSDIKSLSKRFPLGASFLAELYRKLAFKQRKIHLSRSTTKFPQIMQRLVLKYLLKTIKNVSSN